MTPLSTALLIVVQLGHRAGPLPARAITELAELRPAVTLSAWLAAHPDDAFLPFQRDSIRENDERWCARATTTEQLADGMRMVRRAYFYPPPPPSSLALPSVGGPKLLHEECLLGTVWIEAAVADSAAGSASAASVRNALTAAYGTVLAGPDVFFGRIPTDSQRRLLSRMPAADAMLLGLHYFGAAAWRTPGRWQVDSIVIVSAFDRGFDRRQAGGRVLVFAHLPIAKLGFFRDVIDRNEAASRHTAELVARAAALSRLDRARTTRLVAMLAAADSAYHERGSTSAKVVDSQAVEVIRDWTVSARGLAPAQRAAALLAADQFLGSSPMPYLRGQRQDTSRVAYEQLGVVFARDELGGGYNYTHNWLDEAMRLDPHGSTGQLGTLALLRMGFNETGMCGGGSEAFRRVITTGEQLLAGPLDTATAAEVHRLVGDAYADIVALAAGAGVEYADTATYVAEAAGARSQAIVHYRQSLLQDHVSQEARSAWLEAWRLIAGLPPTATHFFCVYD